MEKKKRIRRTKQELIASGYYKDKAEKAKKPKIRHRRTKQELIASGYYNDKNLLTKCIEIKRILIASINTAKGNKK
jgi:hypothetical protein